METNNAADDSRSAFYTTGISRIVSMQFNTRDTQFAGHQQATKLDGAMIFDAFAAKQVSAVGWVFDGTASGEGRTERGAWIGTKRTYDSPTPIDWFLRPAKLRWFEGGLSKTILVVEKAGLPVRIDGSNVTRELALNGKRVKTFSWIQGSYVGWAENLTIRSPNLKGTVNFSNTRHPFSFHPGGAHVSMCDASIRFMTEDVSPVIMFALAVRNKNVEFVE